MINQTAKTTFRELLRSHDWSMARLQRKTGIGQNRMYDTVARGVATPQECESIAQALGCEVSMVVEALAETARSLLGEKELRGGKRNTESTVGGREHGNFGHGSAGNVPLDPDGEVEGHEPARDGAALPAEAAASDDQPLRRR